MTPPAYQTTPASSLYVHVPFCRHRCGYCNFSVLAGRDDLHDQYLNAIDREMQGVASGQNLQTIFIGGGTPTQLSGERWRRLFEILHRHFDIAPDAEISAEANPEDCGPALLSTMADLGVNRISFGVQSLSTEKLNILQRGHTPRQATDAIRTAAELIGRVSIDLIYGAPGETLATWQRDLESALSLPIEHLSAYALTYEKGTQFWSAKNRGTLSAVDEELEDEMESSTRAMTAAAGFHRYEISSYARPGARCRHNLAYWRGDSWLAAGPAAAAFDRGVRCVNHRSVTRYLQKIERDGQAVDEREIITPPVHLAELAAFGVRQIDGVELAELSRRSGLDASEFLNRSIERMIGLGWLVPSAEHLRLTALGLRYADAVAAEFLAQSPV